MTIDAASSMSTSASALNYNQMQTGSASSSSTSTELTEEEKQYDVDGDGTLSITEKAAYLEAQSKSKSLESISKSMESKSDDSANNSAGSESAASVSISEEALKLQKEAQQKGNPPPKPPDASEMSDDELKSTLSDMKEANGRLPKELASYNDSDIDSLSEDELNDIRESIAKMQEKADEQKNKTPENQQATLMMFMATEYSKFKSNVS